MGFINLPNPDDEDAIMRAYRPNVNIGRPGATFPQQFADDDAPEVSMADYALVSDEAPADLTDANRTREVPTTSTNAARPRTVAAAYDENRAVLTVVFRDGTIWNYYDVTPGQWQNFHASISKGRPWINDQAFGRGEAADTSAIPAEVASLIYSEARKAQLKAVTKYRYNTGQTRTIRAKSGKTYTYGVRSQRVSKTKLKQAGKNTATANKPKKP